jgi:hypothetical protein
MLLIVLMLAACGQPLQISTPSQTQVRPTRLTNEPAAPSVTASGVPSLAPSEEIPPDMAATPLSPAQAEPTRAEATSVTAAPAPIGATQTPVVIVVPLPQTPETNEQRWRARQQDRTVNDPPQMYVARNPVTLWWYDPLTSQSVPIGTIGGEFPVQAEFILRGEQQPALEVSYVINHDFGLTAISEAVRERMKAAGYSQSVEAYVLRTDDVQPK